MDWLLIGWGIAFLAALLSMAVCLIRIAYRSPPRGNARALRTISYYRGEIQCCPECGEYHADVCAFEVVRPKDNFNFAFICPETGNEIFVAVDLETTVE